MNFVSNIEECLRDLAAASRQKHPGVKEACERAVLKLRVLQSQYVKDVRMSNTPTTELFQSSEILHPFLLASNYPNANYTMLEVSFRAFRKLMDSNAIVHSDGIHMIRVYQIQAQVVMTQYSHNNTILSKSLQSNKNDKQPSTTSQWFGLSSVSSSAKTNTNTVSSSSGKTGEKRYTDLQTEKLALEILSSLLQLLELIKHSTIDNMDTWGNALALASLWEELPDTHKVKQAAHSTLSQILCLYFTVHDNPNNNNKANASSWDNVLGVLDQKYSGLFQTCKPLEAAWVWELCTHVWNEPWTKPDIIKTMGVLLKHLEKLHKVLSLQESLRLVVFTQAVFVTHGQSHPNECRQLFSILLKQISLATDACRQHHDFEDGYVYEHHNHKGLEDVSEKTHGCLFPDDLLYKAAFCLELTYHVLSMDATTTTSFVMEQRTLSILAETLSDYCSIGTSCRDHIFWTVSFCQAQSCIKPTIFLKAEQTCNAPKTIVGETMWLALQGVLRIGECLQDVVDPCDCREWFQEIFSPSLAVLQHILKRFVGSAELVGLALSGYSALTTVCLPMEECAVERKVLLTSLSKLSLPAWGKHDTSGELQDHHIKTLLCLLRIVHLYYDHIDADWDIILWTFEQLSVLEIASPRLSETAYHASLAVAAVYQRFASFSTCFSDDSVLKLVQALAEICQSILVKRDVVGDSETVLPERKMTADSKTSDDNKESSISGKIMSMGVRAIYGNSSTDLDYSHNKDDAAKHDRSKKSYYQDYRLDFVARLSPSSAAIRTSSVGRLPFSLVLLSDVVMANLFRSKECRDQVLVAFSGLGGTSPAVRPFIMDMTSMLLMHKLSSAGSLPIVWHERSKLVLDDPMQSQLLAVEPVEKTNGTVGGRNFSQTEALTPLCESICTTEKAEVAMSSLEVLNSMLEGTGQNLRGDVWPMVIQAIASLSGESTYKLDRSSSEWAQCCLSAFRSLKLIVDDFLGHLRDETNSSKSHKALLECCSSFVGSHHDINTSLTAIGLLWTIADQHPDSSAVDQALSKLAKLSSDDRPEVRNAAVNTLFSFIAGRGGDFTTEYWESCVTKTIFGVYDIVAQQTDSGSSDSADSSAKSKTRYEVRLHHSRDSAGKMWVATQVLVLRGLNRVLRSFFFQMLDSVDAKPTNDSPWFRRAWIRILDVAFDAGSQGAGRDNLDIRNIGIELLVVCCQLASEAGIHAAITPARVGTNMEVVNGALRSVREAQTQNAVGERNHSEAIKAARKAMFLESFLTVGAFEEKVVRNLSSSDDTDLQVLSKFCAHIAKLYECGQNDEFKSDSKATSVAMLLGDKASDHLLDRVIRIVVSVLKSSAGDAKAKYLNQGQRCSLDLLKQIAANGSPVAFEELISIAGPAFFIRKDSDGDESESGEIEVVKHSATLLSFEAASIVASEIPSEKVSDECRVFVLRSMLEDFIREYDISDPNKVLDARERRLYKRFIPVLQSGSEGCARLATAGMERFDYISNGVWVKLMRSLSIMLTPLSLGKGTLKIPRVSEVVTIVSIAQSSVVPSCTGALSVELSSGASRAFDAAKRHASNAEANPESDFGKKSKRHRDDLLKLFHACFSGACALDPNDATLRTIARSVLDCTLSQSRDSVQELSTDAAIMVCLSILENGDTDMLVAVVFPSLCQILTSPHSSSKLKDAAGRVLTGTNIASTLQLAQERYERAEQRAEDAERRADELQATVEGLQEEKSRLKNDSDANESRSSIWGL